MGSYREAEGTEIVVELRPAWWADLAIGALVVLLVGGPAYVMVTSHVFPTDVELLLFTPLYAAGAWCVFCRAARFRQLVSKSGRVTLKRSLGPARVILRPELFPTVRMGRLVLDFEGKSEVDLSIMSAAARARLFETLHDHLGYDIDEPGALAAELVARAGLGPQTLVIPLDDARRRADVMMFVALVSPALVILPFARELLWLGVGLGAAVVLALHLSAKRNPPPITLRVSPEGVVLGYANGTERSESLARVQVGATDIVVGHSRCTASGPQLLALCSVLEDILGNDSYRSPELRGVPWRRP